MKNKNYIKIISGKYKGIKIKLNKNKYNKPTLNIIRERLFNWLNPYIKNKICLDCFSGSGVLSFESISRGAKHVTILEKNYKTVINIKQNFNKISKKKYKIININSIVWLKKKKNKNFDIIFIDPPYKSYYIDIVTYILEKNNLIKKNSFIYIETHNKSIIKTPKNWIKLKKHKTQTIKYYLFKKIK